MGMIHFSVYKIERRMKRDSVTTWVTSDLGFSERNQRSHL